MGRVVREEAGVGIWQRLGFGKGGGEARKKVEWPMLDVGYNVRELAGYETPQGKTQAHRFIRSGDTDMLSERDVAFFQDYGVRRVLDLRSASECHIAADDLARQPWVTYKNIELFSYDLHDPALDRGGEPRGFLASSYLTMLANQEAVRSMFAFFAEAKPNECVLYHCAAGMDRTGVTSMLLLGLAGVDRQHIIADYCYSYGTPEEVDDIVFRGNAKRHTRNDIRGAMDTMGQVYDRVRGAYGSVRGYLTACGVTQRELTAVRDHLVATQPQG